jgi:hypothetical protein
VGSKGIALTGKTWPQKNDQTSAARMTTLASSTVSNFAFRVDMPEAIKSRRSEESTARILAGGTRCEVATMWELQSWLRVSEIAEKMGVAQSANARIAIPGQSITRRAGFLLTSNPPSAS